ncbi:uncharacterized protein LAESUDRAFT_754668 [Laetiporus sulphureus 93-53]|uniref:Uncharacterized protein n=1 Tax=Laetiporus sulphureus 93-53 TaxID=1314785 RepID=A0A165HTV3_9APHY|nr:uncharacterized protein LAESUDRAFT_754668 [Laetiporus sulphureus 93-53]KZT12180.1 hypothetical protein LAESUDRAFT_754668 [Laetiporus sulphureus 93-53]
MSLNICVTTTITRSTSELGPLLNSDGDELPPPTNLSDEALAESWRSAHWEDDEDRTGNADDEQLGYPHHDGATYNYVDPPEDESQPSPANIIKEQTRYAQTVTSSSNPAKGQVSLIAPDVASPYDVFIVMPLTFLMECDGHHLYVHRMGMGDFTTFHAFVLTWDNLKVAWHLYSEVSPHRVFSHIHFTGKEEGVEQYEVELFRMFFDQVTYGDVKTPHEFTSVIFQPLITMIEHPGWLTDGVKKLEAVHYQDRSISHWAPTDFHPHH